jgi:hypothetical protein
VCCPDDEDAGSHDADAAPPWEELRRDTFEAALVLSAGDVPYLEALSFTRLIECLDTFDKSEPYSLEDGLVVSLACARGLIDATTGKRLAMPTGDPEVDRYRTELVAGCRAFGRDPDGFELLMAPMRRIALAELQALRGNHDAQIQAVHRWFLYSLLAGPRPVAPFPEWAKAALVRSFPRSVEQVFGSRRVAEH